MFTGIDIGNLSSSALLAITILLILSGRLVPRRTLKDKQDEADRWRKAYESERTARGIADAQIDELLEVAKTTRDVIVAMSTASAKIRQSGDADASTTP